MSTRKRVGVSSRDRSRVVGLPKGLNYVWHVWVCCVVSVAPVIIGHSIVSSMFSVSLRCRLPANKFGEQVQETTSKIAFWSTLLRARVASLLGIHFRFKHHVKNIAISMKIPWRKSTENDAENLSNLSWNQCQNSYKIDTKSDSKEGSGNHKKTCFSEKAKTWF